ncbi:MAG: hypothetical protein J6T25_03525 [Bacilli bacterium]|nr:hypothetical protein [Bacilli bacterium]
MLNKEKKELEQDNKEQKKKQAKRDLKIVIASVIGTLLFIVILLLLVLLGLKKCNNNSSDPQSSNSSSIKYDYGVNKIDEVFKGIVKNQLVVDGFDEDILTDVVSVTYSDISTSFDLNIEVRSESKVYYYRLSNYPYSGFDNFVPYLLSLDLDTKLSLDEGTISLDTYLPTSETITTDKECRYLISSNMSGTDKYFSGFYYQNNEYYIYQNKILISNPFSETSNQVIGLDSPLYGYFQKLMD